MLMMSLAQIDAPAECGFFGSIYESSKKQRESSRHLQTVAGPRFRSHSLQAKPF